MPVYILTHRVLRNYLPVYAACHFEWGLAYVAPKPHIGQMT